MTLPEKIVMASGNAGKIREVSRLLEPYGVAVVPQTDFGIHGVEETGTTFEANAVLKALHATRITGLPAIADDSGLVVHALDGQPGVRSARYAGEDASDDENIDKLLLELEIADDAERRAAFHCVACYLASKESEPVVAHGVWNGSILAERKGAGGFGYDPVFFDDELGRSAAELGAEEKNARSHRGKAFGKLAGMLGVDSA